MLHFQNIYSVIEANHRLKRGYRWSSLDHSLESDRMVSFTLGQQAIKDSKENLNLCLELGQNMSSDLLVLHDNKVQFVGQSNSQALQNILVTKEWRKSYQDWASTTWEPDALIEYSDRSECCYVRGYRTAFAMKEHIGIYDVRTGTRLVNRREIISRFWEHGFASWRGRPLAIASVRWSGTRGDLEEVTQLANKYWNRRHSSDVAKKMCSAYTAINRYAAWPGAW